MKNVQMPPYKQREERQLAAIESEAFPAVNRLGAKCVLKHYNACDIANVVFKKRLELVRMVCTDWGLADNEKIPGSDISGAWVKKRFCYGESVELITAKGLCADVVEILWNSGILFDALQAWDSAPEEWVQALADWVLAVFVNSSTFGVLDLEGLDTDLADLLDSVY